MHRITRVSVFILFFPSIAPLCLLSQDSLSVSEPATAAGSFKSATIDTIILIGNDVTKDFVILREMSLKVGDTVSVEAAEFDKNRIYSLGLFNRVDMRYEVEGEKVKLYVIVNERWYLFPFPVVGIKDRDWKKFYYGLGVLHYNFRGRNEKVSASFALGYDPFVSLRYRNPLLSRESELFLDTRLFYSRVRNKSLVSQKRGINFDEDHYGIYGTIGKRLHLFRSLSVTLGYEILTVSQNEVGRTLSPDGRDAFVSAGVRFLHDSRDLAEYPSKGEFLWLSFEKYGFGQTVVNYYRVAFDGRGFVPLIGGVGAAGRLFTNIAGGGTVPNYHHVFFGYQERIRGHFKDIYEGEDLIGTSLELRIPLLPVRFFSVGAIPVSEFALWRFGVFATLFGDAGKVWYRADPFTLRDFAKGYGVGLNFLLPYNTVLRLEYALDELRRGQFIFDLSASF